MMRTRLLFALMGALACMVAALLAEGIYASIHLAHTLDDRVSRVLVFRSDLTRRLENAGGRTGDVEIILAWNNKNDLDLSCTDPNGEYIFYGHKRSRSGGELDVDQNVAEPFTSEPVENIYWPFGRAPRGRYQVWVDYYGPHGGPEPTYYRCTILEHGRIHTVTGSVTHAQIRQPKIVYEFDTSRAVVPGDGLWPAILRGMLVTGLWAMLLGTLLALALAGGQQWLWLRRYRQPLMSGRRLGTIVLWGALMGLTAGALGQLLFSLIGCYLSEWPILAGRACGWALLGLIVGYGLAQRVPNLPGTAAGIVGLIGGALSASLFMTAMGHGSDALGRLLAAALLGLLIGVLIDLDIDPPIDPDEGYLTTTHFSLQTLSLRPNRAGSSGSLRGNTTSRFPR
jgi:hypothetical protein